MTQEEFEAKYEDHPIAAIYPLMDAEQLQELAQDIKAHGLLESIILHEGKILDGRNRYQACEIAAVPVRFETFGGDSPTAFVISMNAKRRHLTPSQRAAAAVLAEPHFAEEAKKRQVEGGKTAGRGRPKSYICTTCGETFPVQVWHCSACGAHCDLTDKTCRDCHQGKRPKKDTPKLGEAVRQAASAFCVSHGYVSAAKKLKKEQPEIFKQVHAGRKTLQQAERESRQAERQKKRRTASQNIQVQDDRIIVGDFRQYEAKVPDGSLSLIFTDPPYDRKSAALLPDLARFAKAKLAEGGSLIVYVAHINLHAALDAFDAELRYWWTIACVHSGSNALMREYGIRVGWKPVLWYVKGLRDDKTAIVEDVMSGGMEKSDHDWQQAEAEAAYWIEKLCPPDGIVCDPFLGSGTTALAAKKLKRQWIGFEIDPETAAVANAKISQG